MASKDEAPPGPLIRFLLWIDPAFFYWITCVLKFIAAVLDKGLLGPIFGYSITKGKRDERRWAEALPARRGAQKVRVLFRGAYSLILNHTLDNFFYVHEEYVDPKYILDNDNVTLQSVTDKHAVFCVSDPEFNVFETKMAPFVWIIQYFKAQRLIIVSHDVFNQLADELGDPSDRSVTLLDMTARCGSTLVSQMVARGAPDTRVMSEPWSFVHIHGLYIQGKIGFDYYRRLLRSTTRLICKPEKKHPELKRIFIKMSHYASGQFPLLKEMFPDFKQMFITRHPKACFMSQYKVAKSAPQIWFWLGVRKRFFVDHQVMPYDDFVWWDRYRRLRADALLDVPMPPLAIGYAIAAGVDEYMRTKHNFELAMIYEDLRADPAGVMAKVFEIMGVPVDRVPAALEAMNDDAQQGVLSSRGSIKLPESDYKAVDDTFKVCDSPLRIDMSLDDLRRLIY